MYIHSVKLINFKSVADYPEAEIILEPKVTSIIGRNESGKSNILDGISRIDFLKRNTNAFLPENVNRNVEFGIENKYIIMLKPTSNDVAVGVCEDTKIEITKTNYIVTGGFLIYYLKTLYGDLQELVSVLKQIGTNPFQVKEQELTNYKNYIVAFEREEYVNIYSMNNAFSFMISKISSLSADTRNEILSLLENIKSKWEQSLTMFPTLFYRKTDKHLKTTYKLDEIEKELKNPRESTNSLLHDLVKLIGVPEDEFILAAKTGSLPQQGTIRRKINRIIDEKVNREFQQVYGTEEIVLDLEFNAGAISFMVRSGDGEALALSERSNGLRWYLELFIDAQANNITGRNVVYLLDEPGTSLHVNAQRELLSLFARLAEQDNQIIYTTHSPYMLDLEKDGVHRIRAVIKGDDGNTKVYKTAYDARIAPETQEDTLAPIINAIGMSLQSTVGPALGKLNVVTEGMSDYIYICMMAKVLGIDTDKYAIIPSVGATNSINICEILHGWKCKFIAAFDYDKEGVEKGGEYMRKELFYELGKQFIYLKDVNEDEIEASTYKTIPYVIEDLVTKEEINEFCSTMNVSTNTSKTLLAKLMSNAVEQGKYVLGEECCENFKNFFSRCGLI